MMPFKSVAAAVLIATASLLPFSALAQETAAEATPTDALSWMDGEWRGTARIMSPQGPVEITQTERVGPVLGGRARVIEGKGYDDEGNVVFNAFAVISPAQDGDGFVMQSWTLDRAGAFPLQATDTGYRWEIETPRGTTVYEANFEDGMWRQTGHLMMEGREPFEFFRMDLERVGDTDWPAGDAVMPTD